MAMLACAGGIATSGVRSDSDIGPMLAPAKKALNGK